MMENGDRVHRRSQMRKRLGTRGPTSYLGPAASGPAQRIALERCEPDRSHRVLRRIGTSFGPLDPTASHR